MGLKAALTKLLEEYPKESQKAIAGSALANFVRKQIPDLLRPMVGNENRYKLEGSVGQGNWARVSWIGILDRLITGSAQHGYYIVYLVREDCSGVYLSLNQGVTEVRQQYGSGAKQALRARARDHAAKLGSIDSRFMQGDIDLKVTSRSSLGADYEAGSICAKLYRRAAIPDDAVLEEDLRVMLALYFDLSARESAKASAVEREDDEVSVGDEDLSVLREHKRIERNQVLATKAKRALGYLCQVYGFDFGTVYGQIGRGYIEAHHLMPLSEVKGQKVRLDPRSAPGEHIREPSVCKCNINVSPAFLRGMATPLQQHPWVHTACTVLLGCP